MVIQISYINNFYTNTNSLQGISNQASISTHERLKSYEKIEKLINGKKSKEEKVSIIYCIIVLILILILILTMILIGHLLSIENMGY